MRAVSLVVLLAASGCAVPGLSGRSPAGDGGPPVPHTIVVSAEGPSFYVENDEAASALALGPGEVLAVRMDGRLDVLVVAAEDEGARGGGLAGPHVLRLRPGNPVGQLVASSLSTPSSYEVLVFACASTESSRCTDWRMVPPRSGEGPGLRLTTGAPEVDQSFAPDPPLDPDDAP